MLQKFKYADLLDDDVFKLVFGRESTKEIMIEFLNQVITDRTIVDLEFIDKEMHPVERDAKGTVYDMFCKTDDGSRIIVEVQRRKQPFYPEGSMKRIPIDFFLTGLPLYFWNSKSFRKS